MVRRLRSGSAGGRHDERTADDMRRRQAGLRDLATVATGEWKQRRQRSGPPGAHELAILARLSHLDLTTPLRRAPLGRRSHVAFRPLAQLEEARSHGAAALGQLVDNAHTWTIEDPAIDQAGLGQFVETARQHPLANAWDGSRQDGKAGRALQEQPQDHARPTLPQQGEDPSQALIAFTRVLVEFASHPVSVSPPGAITVATCKK